MASCVPAGHCESSMGACTSSEPAAMTASAAATRMRRVVTGVVDVDDGNLVSCLTPTIARKSGLSGCVADWMAMLVLKRRAALSSEGSVLKVRSDFGKANRLVKNSATFRCNAHDRRHGLVGIVDATSGGSTPLAAPTPGHTRWRLLFCDSVDFATSISGSSRVARTPKPGICLAFSPPSALTADAPA